MTCFDNSRGYVGAALAMAVLVGASTAFADEREARLREIEEGLRDPSASVRARAARGILHWQQAPESVGSALVEAAKVEMDRDAYVPMLCALGRTSEPEAGPILERHLRSPDWRIRRCANKSMEDWAANMGRPVPSLPPPEAPKRVAEGFHLEEGGSDALGTSGIVVLATGYLAAAITSAVVLTKFEGFANHETWGLGFVPIVGPVIIPAVASREPDADGSDIAGGDPGYIGIMAASGIVQVTGLVLFLVGYAPPDTVQRDAAVPEVAVGPGSFSATWTF